MSTHATSLIPASTPLAATAEPERIVLEDGTEQLRQAALRVGAIALVIALLWSGLFNDGLRRFAFAYLTNFCFFLSLALGGLFFVLIQHLTRAGWSVTVRRLAELLMMTLPTLAVLAIPLVISVLARGGAVYPWDVPARAARAAGESLGNRTYLNPAFFLIRLAIYFATWVGIAHWFSRRSFEQDQTADAALSLRMQARSAPALIAFGITLAWAGFDLIMSLDPAWKSTMFGVYFFAGASLGAFAAVILLLSIFQKRGYLLDSVRPDHYYDLGKFLFAFVFFWGYIAYSQYMLIWYASIPEEVEWLRRRGATSVAADINGWTVVSVLLLLGQLLIPFAGLLASSVKRNRKLMTFWAIWLLAFHWLDMFWLVMPQLDGRVHFGVTELATFIGIGAFVVAALARAAAAPRAIRPTQDPRLPESLAFEEE